jgi:uncharacterized membrane protein YfhO
MIVVYLKEKITVYLLILILVPIFLIANSIVFQEKLMARGQQEQNNASATDLENLRNTIIPEAEEVNEANSELIKICTDSPNSKCDNTIITIYNDCKAYPAYVATHIPSCGDSRLFSYLIARGLME